jgi:kynurenine 3-monooxygenase
MNTVTFRRKVCVVGAGLTGSLLTIILAKRGFEVDMYEKRPDIRKKLVSGNRTIAMSLSVRGIRGLERAGLSENIVKNTLPKHSRVVHKKNGSLFVQQYGKDGDTINTVDRTELNSQLLNEAEKTGKVNFYPDTRCNIIDADNGLITFTNEILNESYTKEYRWIIGADGIFSDVRQNLIREALVRSELRKAKHGYRELVIPPDENGNYRLDKNCVHVWPRKDYIMVGLPSHGGKFTCNLFLPSEGKLSLKTIENEKQIHELFDRDFKKMKPLMPNLIEDYFNHAASEILTVKCDKWNYRDRVLLIGDAAHAIVPFFAMGMNVGFEDCTVFDDLMKKYNNDLERVFLSFGKKRKPETDAISDLSFKNFSEISKSPNDDYHKIWELERTIWDMYPGKWIPLYPMIAFSHIPFTEVIRRNDLQKEMIENLVAKFKLDGIVSRGNEIKNFLAPYVGETALAAGV